MTDSRNDLPSINSSNFEQRVRETLMVYMGRQGNPLDRGITLRDLVDSGMAIIKNGAIAPGSGSGGTGTGGSGEPEYIPDFSPPPSPTGFTVTAGLSYIFVEHDNPIFSQGHGYLRTAVYGKVRNVDDPEPVFADAVKVAEFSGTVFAMPSEPATTWHLWIKWESKDGILSVDPSGGTNGLAATTGQDVGKLLEILTGQITASQLYADLGKRIDLIDGSETMPGSVAARIKSEAQARNSALAAESNARTRALLNQAQTLGAFVQSEAVARQAEDESLSTRISQATASISNADARLTAAIEDEVNVRATAIEALAEESQLIAARVEDAERKIAVTEGSIVNEARLRLAADSAEASARTALAVKVTNIQTGLTATQSKIVEDFYTRTDVDSVMSVKLQELENKVYSPVDGAVVSSTYIRDNYYTKADTDIALAESSQATVAAFNGQFAAVEQKQTVLADKQNTLSAQYTVKVDAGGRVAGFGLASDTTTGSAFAVRANRFYIAPPEGSNSTATSTIPFIVRTTTEVEGGVIVPPGVYMDSALIRNASITNAKIGTAAIDDAKVANLSAMKLTAGDGTIGGILKSANYTATDGWRITPDGNAEFNNALLRGTIYADAGLIGGFTITDSQILGINPATGSGIMLNKSGAFSLGSYTSKLSFDPADNTLRYSGSLNVKSSTNPYVSRMEITDRCIKVFEGGVLRIQIGDLSA
jgi:hypothetical protein